MDRNHRPDEVSLTQTSCLVQWSWHADAWAQASLKTALNEFSRLWLKSFEIEMSWLFFRRVVVVGGMGGGDGGVDLRLRHQAEKKQLRSRDNWPHKCGRCRKWSAVINNQDTDLLMRLKVMMVQGAASFFTFKTNTEAVGVRKGVQTLPNLLDYS